MEIEFCHSLKDMTGLFFVGFGVGGGNEEVVHVDDKPSFSDHVAKGVVHELLEHGEGVAETKEHDGQFKESLVHDESHLPLVAILDADVVVSPSNVEFGEVVSVFQLVHEVGNERKGVVVTGGVFVEVTVVLARAEFAVLRLDKEEGGCLGGVGQTNFPSH